MEIFHEIAQKFVTEMRMKGVKIMTCLDVFNEVGERQSVQEDEDRASMIWRAPRKEGLEKYL
jgi:hypothetical protein